MMGIRSSSLIVRLSQTAIGSLMTGPLMGRQTLIMLQRVFLRRATSSAGRLSWNTCHAPSLDWSTCTKRAGVTAVTCALSATVVAASAASVSSRVCRRIMWLKTWTSVAPVLNESLVYCFIWRWRTHTPPSIVVSPPCTPHPSFGRRLQTSSGH